MTTTVLDRLYGARRSITSGRSPVETLAQIDAAIAALNGCVVCGVRATDTWHEPVCDKHYCRAGCGHPIAETDNIGIHPDGRTMHLACLTALPEPDVRDDASRPDPGPMEAPDLVGELF